MRELSERVNHIPLSVEYAIREAVALLRASRRHFKSRHVEQARELLEQCLVGLPERKSIIHAEKTDRRQHP